ncbi:MAG: DUF523 domain-containing protein [Gammaproteobacteria bacterium]|nr:DUF523 domain-containing protein [Gammaproteobacteria bacterium]
MEKHTILISACLLGNKVRYDGKDSFCDHPILQQWQQEQRLIILCPEMAGGLPTPRPACQIVGSGGGSAVLARTARVISDKGNDSTECYLKGAHKALELAQTHAITMAILKARSPSCGNSLIYDGSFSKNLIVGQGVTAALLTQHGFKVFNEEQLEEAILFFKSVATPALKSF